MEEEIHNDQKKEKRKRDLAEKEEDSKAKKKYRNKLGIYLGLLLVLIGLIWYAFSAGLIPSAYFDYWPQFALVIIGLIILIKSF